MSIAILRKKVADDPSVSVIPIGELNVAPEYQRDLNVPQIEKMIRSWDPYQLNELTVSERADGSYWVIDGRHRLAAALKRGLQNLRCFVVRGLSEDQEAALFRKLNKNRRPVNAWDDFRAALAEKETAALQIKAVVDEAGFHISRSGGYTQIKAVSGLRKIYQWGGQALLRKTLAFIVEVWEGDSDATDNLTLLGLAGFLNQYWSHPAFRRERLVEVMSKIKVSRIIRDAQGLETLRGGLITSNTATTRAMLVIRAHYNRGLRTRKLPMPVDARGHSVSGYVGEPS